MTEITRKAGAVWNGDSKSGAGIVSTESQALFEKTYTHKTRFDGSDTTGTNPEELIAAAHAACFSMALAGVLKKKGFNPKQTSATATCKMNSQNGGYAITGMELHIRAEVPDINDNNFQKIVREADKECPVSNLLRTGLEIEIDAALV